MDLRSKQKEEVKQDYQKDSPYTTVAADTSSLLANMVVTVVRIRFFDNCPVIFCHCSEYAPTIKTFPSFILVPCLENVGTNIVWI